MRLLLFLVILIPSTLAFGGAAENLLFAAQDGDARRVREILKRNPKLDLGVLTSKSQTSPLHLAVEANRLEVVRIFLGRRESSKLLRLRDRDGFTPLHLASREGHIEVVETILERADAADLLRMKVSGAGWTALQLASFGNQIEVVKIVLDKTKPRDLFRASDLSQSTFLSWAIEKSLSEVAMIVLARPEASELLSKKDGMGRMALHWAAIRGSGKLMKRILEMTLDVDPNGLEVPDVDGSSLLGLAVRFGNIEAVAELLSKGFSLEKVVIEGQVMSARAFLVEQAQKSDFSDGHKQILNLIIRGESNGNSGWQDGP